MPTPHFSESNPRSWYRGRRPRLVRFVAADGSAWAFFQGQLRHVARRGFDVTLVSSDGEYIDDLGRSEEIHTVGLPVQRAPIPTQDLLLVPRLVRIFRRLRPDIVHSDMPKAMLFGSLAARTARVPVCLQTMHGIRSDGHFQRAWQRKAVIATERAAGALADHVYCVSPSVRRRAAELKLMPLDRSSVIGEHGSINGMDVARFVRTDETRAKAAAMRAKLGLPPDATVVGFVGRLVRDKGIVELVEAFCRVHPQLPQSCLLLVGRLESFNALPAELVRRVEQHPAIFTTGMIDDVVPAYHLIDFLVLPSYREGLPYCPLEAAACSLPTIATTVTGCIDAVQDGVTGALVPPRNIDALARALVTYIQQPDLRRRQGEAALRAVKTKFRPEDIWHFLHNEYCRHLNVTPPMP